MAKEVREQEEHEKQELEAFYKKDLERLSFQASHDELTGLYNRFGYDFLISELELSSVYLLMVDVDDFKAINDNYGHEIGDKVLIKIAETLKKISVPMTVFAGSVVTSSLWSWFTQIRAFGH